MRRICFVVFAVLAIQLSHSFSQDVEAAEPLTKITWHGHAAFEIHTPSGKVLFIDPWLTNPTNPKSKSYENLNKSDVRADYILLTHGHFDHVGDAVSLAKKTGAKLVASFELGNNLARLKGFPEKQMDFTTLMNIGGVIELEKGAIKIHMTPAVHSSSLENPYEGRKGKGPLVYAGNPAGFVLILQGGPSIYHSGDTAFFSDMELIGKRYKPDLALINIGGHFGMEVDMAARAARVLRSRWVVPHHFGTFPVLTQNADAFVEELKGGARGLVLKPGETIEFVGDKLKEENE